MSIFSFPLFGCFVIFLVWFAYERSKNDKLAKKLNSEFWQRESQANFSRKKNMDTVSYITLPLDTFPIGKHTDNNDITNAEQILLSLSDKRMLNLTGKTATDLKLEYGAANLVLLDEYDENYISMVKALQQYAKGLHDTGHTEDAATVLEFAVSAGSDIKATYVLLANIYVSLNTPEKINDLTASAKELDSLMKPAILEALSEFS